MQPKQQPVAGVYRGRRRLPKLPGRRYAAVVGTAMMGAALVAVAAGAVVPDHPRTGSAYDSPSVQAVYGQDRLNALDRANRSEARPGPALSSEQAAPIVDRP